MRLNALAATATIAVLALAATACKSSSHASGGPTTASNPPATQTQADSASPETTASTSASPAASAAASSPSASPSAAASTAQAPAGAAINTCSLLSGAQAAALSGRAFGAGTESEIASGQEQCAYPYADGVAMDIIVYEPSSVVSWSALQSVLSNVGPVTPVSGVGDKAMFAGIELDVSTGQYLFAIEAAGGLGDDTGAIAIAKQLVGELASK